MTYMTPQEKTQILCNMIDNLMALATDRSAQSFQMLLDYRKQVFEMIEQFQKEDEDKSMFVQHVYNELTTRFEKILQKSVH